jgi:general secretion pathway protein D
MIRGGMTVRSVALVVGLAVVGFGCAAKLDYRRGQAEAKAGNWDMAVARLTRALQRKPNDIGYKIALENARIQASRQHTELARKHLAANDLDKAADELEIASKYDPANKSASDDLSIVRERIRQREEERERLANYDETKARAAALPVVPVLSPRSPKPILLKWNDQSLQKLFETLGKLAGVNILFDEGFRDKNVTVNLNGINFQEALDQITFVNRMFYKVVDQNTLIIVQESAAKRRSYDELILRTFYLQNAEIKEIETIVKTALGSGPKVSSNPTLGAITIVGTPDHLALASRIIELNDKPRGEVVIEVQVMEVNRNSLKQYGIQLSNYGARASFEPTGIEDESAGGITRVRAHMLSSLNLSDFVVSVPSAVFSQFLQNDSTARILAAPKLRAAEGKKSALKIGTEVPVPTTTFQTNVSNPNTGTYTPATSFNYRNVGITMEITPKVSAAGEITLETNAEFSLLGGTVPVAGAGDLPTFLTRSVNGIVRVRDGETVLLGGLLQDDENSSMAGVLGLNKIPILNSIFSGRRKERTTTEVVISMTPHLVRAPKITAEDLVGLNVGTVEVVRVPGARPPLFGAAPEEVAAPAAEPVPVAPTLPGGPVTPGASSPVPAVEPRETGVLDAPPGGVVPPPAPMSAPGSGTAVDTAAPPPTNGIPSAVRASLSPPLVTTRTGEAISIGIVAMGAQGVTSAELILSFDAGFLEALDAAPGPLFTLDGSTVSTEKNLEPGRIRARFTRSLPAAGSGVIANVTFRTLRTGLSSVKVEAFGLSGPGGTVAPTVSGPAQVNVE